MNPHDKWFWHTECTHKLDAIVQKLLQQLQASQVENGDNAFWLVYGSGRR